MIAEELLFYLSLPLSSSPVSPSRHSSPDDGQLDSFTHSHIKKGIQMNQQMRLDSGHLKWIFFFKNVPNSAHFSLMTNLVSND